MRSLLSSRCVAAVIAIAALLTTSSRSWAQSNWTVTGATGAWGTAGNWSPSGVPGAVGANANLSNAVLTANQTVNMGAARTVGVLSIGSTAAFTQTLTDAFTLTFDNTASPALLNINGNNANTISVTTVAATDPINITQNGSGLFTISSVISGAGAINKLGAGTGVVAFTGNNTYTGPITVTTGTLRGTQANSFGQGAANLIAAGGTFQSFADANLAFNRNVLVSANSTFQTNQSTAAGTTTRTTTYGTLSIGAFTLNATRGGNITGAAFGNTTFGATTLTGNATFAPAANSILTLASVGGAGTFTLNGPGGATTGVLALGGTGTFSGGGFTWTNGNLQLNSAAPLSGVTTLSFPAASGTNLRRLLINGGVTTAYNISIPTGSHLNTLGRGLIEHANAAFGGAGGQARINGSLTFDNTGASAGGLIVGGTGAGNELVFGGPINQISASSFSQRDGRVIYEGGGNITGTFTLTGTAIIGAPNGLPPLLSNVLVGGSAASTLDIAGFSQTIQSLTVGNGANSGTVNFNGGTVSLNGSLITSNAPAAGIATFNGNTGGILNVGATQRTFTINDSTAADDAIFNTLAVNGSGGFIKDGTGTLNMNTIAVAGPVAINAGVVRGSFNANGGLSLGAATIEPGALLANATAGATITATTFAINGGGNLNFNIGTGGDVINVSNLDGFTVAGSTNVNVAGFIGTPLVVGNYNLITYTTSTTGPGTGGFALMPVLPNRAVGSLVDTGTGPGAGAIQLQITSVDSITWTGATDANWDFATQNWVQTTPNTSTAFLNGDDVIFPTGALNTTVSLAAAVSPIRTTFTNDLTTTYTLTGTNAITGTGSMVKSGTGLVILRNPNTFTGSVSITGGTLQLDQSTGLGSITASSGISVSNPGNFLLSAANNNATFNRNISGNGTVTINLNTGGTASVATQIISGTNTGFTGTWVITTTGVASTNGTTRTDSTTTQANFGAGSIVVQNGGQLWYTGNLTNNITITGAGANEGAGGINIVTGLNYSGIGAIRGINGTTLSGNMTIVGTAKIGPYNSTTGSATLTLSGSVGFNNPATDLLVIGGSNKTTASIAVVLTGDNPNLGNIWVNGGSTLSAGTNGSDIIQIGNNGTTGTLGSGNWNIALFGQNAGGGVVRNAVARFSRADGYTLNNGQTILSSSTGTGNDQTRVQVNVGGTGLTLNNTTIDLSNGTNGGALSVGPINSGILNINNGSTVDVGTFFLGEATSLSGTVNQSGATTTVNVINQLRVGHFPTATSVYNLNAGSVNITSASLATSPYTAGVGELNGGLYLGNDGTGIWNQTGGTLNTNWIVLDNRAATTGEEQLNLSGGTVNLRSNWGIIGNPTLTTFAFNWSGGTIQYDPTGTGTGTGTGQTVAMAQVTVTNSVILNTFDATNGFQFNGNISGTGTINTQGGGLITLNATVAQSVTAIIAGPSGVTKIGTAATTLSSVSTYSGATTVSTGRLNLTGSILNSDLSVAANAQIGGEGSAKSLTIAGGTGTTIFFDPNTVGALTATNNFTVSGINTVDFTTAPANSGPFVIVNFGGTTNATPADFALANAANFRPATFTVNPNNVSITLGSANITWQGASLTPTLWDVNATLNWVSPDQKYFNGDFVTFNDADALSFTVATVGAITPGSTTFDAAANYSLTVTGPSTFGGGGSFTKTNIGTLTVVGTLAHTGTTTISNGVLLLGNGTTAANLSANTAVTINTSGILRMTAPGVTAMTVNVGSLSGTGTVEVVAQAIASTNGSHTLTSAGSTAGFTGTMLATSGRLSFGSDASVPVNATQWTVATGDGQFYLTRPVTISGPFSINGFGWQETGGRLGALRLENATMVLSGPITLTGNARINATANANVSGAINGAFSLEINKASTTGGNATLIYTGTTGLTGNINITAGALQVGNGGTTGDISSVAAINFNQLDVNGLTQAATTGTLTFNRSDAVTFSKPILNAPFVAPATVQVTGALSHIGAGTTTFTNADIQLRGGITANNASDTSRLVFNPGGNGGAFTTFGPGAFNTITNMTAAVTTTNAADIEFNTSSNLQFDSVQGSASTGYFIHSGSGTITFGGTVDNSSGKAIVTGGGVLVLAKASSATVRAIGGTTAINAFGLIIDNGTVRLNGTGTDQIFSQTDVRMAPGATFDFNGFSESFDLLAGTGGTVTNGAATASVMTLGEANTTTFTGSTNSFGGVIQDGIGAMGVTKIGTGLQILAGNSTYTGATTVSGGTLSITGSLGNTAVGITGASANLSGTGSIGGAVTLNNASAAIRPGINTGTGTVGTLTFASFDQTLGSVALDLSSNPGSGNDQVVVTGSYNYTGGTIALAFATNPGVGTYNLLSYGTLTGAVPDSAVTINGLTIAAFNASSRYQAGSVNNGTGTADFVSLAFTGNAATLYWNGSEALWTVGSGSTPFNITTPNGTPDFFLTGDNVVFEDTALPGTTTTATINAITVQPNSVLFDNTTRTYTIAGITTGGIGGGATVTKQGAGLVTLGGANTFTGTITVTAGQLRVGSGQAFGRNSGITISGTGQVNFNGIGLAGNATTGWVSSYTISGVGDGTGAITNTGADVSGNSGIINLTLAGNATIGGTGRYDIGGGMGANQQGLSSGTINGAGFTLTKIGTNFVNLRGPASNISYVVDAGILRVENSGTALGATAVAVNTGATLDAFTATTAAPGFVVSNPMTTITDGTLSATANAANQIATFTGPFTLTGNVTATSQGANAVIAVLTGSVGGTGNLTKNLSTMTLTLAGANTFTGTTRVNLGNLFLANTLALQNSTLDTQTVVNGNTVFDQTVVTNAFTFGGLSGSRNLALVNNAGTPAAVTLSVGNNGANTTYSGALTGAGTLTKIGGGTLTLNGINVNTGGTNVNAGVVKGTGRLGGLTSVNTGGTLRAGDSTIGTLELSNGLAVNTGGTLFVQITNGSTPAAAGTGGSTLGTLPNPTSNNFYNILAGTTSFDPNAQFTFDATGVTFTEGATYSYQIAQGAGNQSALSFGAANITPIGVDLNPLYTSITGSAGGAVYLNFVPIPEPALLLVVAGIFGLTRIRRR